MGLGSLRGDLLTDDMTRMTVGLREMLVVPRKGSVAAGARRRRWELLSLKFPDLADMKVVDLGGTPQSWELAPVKPRQLTCVNSADLAGSDAPWISVVRGDACTITGIGSFDLAFSNSTIEHVGGHERRKAFAATLRALAPHYWVQTPNRYFPLEPHFVFPFMQFLPTRQRAFWAERWPLSNVQRASGPAATESVLEIELLGRADMAHYFPEAVIITERLMGLTKSLIAVH
jgi:hypothetical protein